MVFENIIVSKPWGHEYQIYKNVHLGVWHLFLQHGAQTSLHCHPKKKTGLLVLSGQARVSFMNGFHDLIAPQKIMIREGVFHSTKAMSESGVELIEVETPNDKADILRLEDPYGRSGQPYEGKEHYIKDQKLQTIGEEEGCVIVAGSCILTKMKYVGDVSSILDIATYVIFDGYICHHHIKVAGPGDVIDGASLKRLSNKFEVHEMKLLEVKLNDGSSPTNIQEIVL